VAYVKISSNFHSHPSVMLAGNAAVGLWVRLASWAARYSPEERVVPGDLAWKWGTQTQVRRMVESGLAVPTADGGYQLDGSFLGFSRAEARDRIPQQLRERLFARDGHACVECGAADDLTLDHIHPWSLGGPTTDDNLRTLCRSCNSRKGARI
jgi:hypothetical protein